jgi:hypothetical protein
MPYPGNGTSVLTTFNLMVYVQLKAISTTFYESKKDQKPLSILGFHKYLTRELHKLQQ